MTASPPILFLDIDGVLIAYPEGEPTARHFTPQCVEALHRILTAIPDLRIVISSTWRRPQHVNRLHEEWLAAGLDLNLAIDGTPELTGEDPISRLHSRGLEIQQWLGDHPEVTNWVTLDDDRWGIEPVMGSSRCVFTNPQRGLSPDDATKALRILLKQPLRRP